MTSSVTSLKMDDLMMPGVSSGRPDVGRPGAGNDLYAEFGPGGSDTED